MLDCKAAVACEEHGTEKGGREGKGKEEIRVKFFQDLLVPLQIQVHIILGSLQFFLLCWYMT